MRPDRPRSPVAGPPTGPSPPFPIRLSGPIIKGFGRGSKELGIPTANIPIAGLSVGGHEDVESGVYYGLAGVGVDEEGKVQKGEGVVKEMVMSIGWNPFYKNSVRSVVSMNTPSWICLFISFWSSITGLPGSFLFLPYNRIGNILFNPTDREAGGASPVSISTGLLWRAHEPADPGLYTARV